MSKDFFKKTINLFGVDQKLKTYLLKHKSDIKLVYARSFTVTDICIKNNIPVVLETHASAIEHPVFLDIISNAKESSFLGIITIHNNLKTLYVEAGVPEDKILVCHDGFSSDQYRDIEPKKLSPKPKEFVVTYVGGLYREKGIYDIIELAVLAQEKQKNIIFNIFGGEPQQVKAFMQIAKKKALKNIFFKGFIANSEVPEVLASADALLMPYPKLEEFKVMDINTTSPLKLFEYMASARPILTTDIPVISNILTHNKDAYLAEQGNIEDLFRGLCQFLDDPEQSRALSLSAKSKSELFTWENRVDELVKYYNIEV